jgi:hypothetical protein
MPLSTKFQLYQDSQFYWWRKLEDQEKTNDLSQVTEQVNFQWDDDEVHFVLDQHALLDFHSDSSLKQQSANRHVTPLWHIILIPSQPVFALSPWCCLLSGEETNTNFIVFGLTWTRVEPTIYSTRGEHTNHYATDAVSSDWSSYNLLINQNRKSFVNSTCLNRLPVYSKHKRRFCLHRFPCILKSYNLLIDQYRKSFVNFTCLNRIPVYSKHKRRYFLHRFLSILNSYILLSDQYLF